MQAKGPDECLSGGSTEAQLRFHQDNGNSELFTLTSRTPIYLNATQPPLPQIEGRGGPSCEHMSQVFELTRQSGWCSQGVGALAWSARGREDKREGVGPPDLLCLGFSSVYLEDKNKMFY